MRSQPRQRRKGVPWWLRLVFAGDRAAKGLFFLYGVVRDELLLVFLKQETLDVLLMECYGESPSYHPGGAAFEQGLFDWEEQAIRSPAFPTAGHVLVGGVGGGRELQALSQRGYAVTAFEPCEALARSAAAVALRHPAARFAQASYQDLVAAVDGRPGPLRSFLDVHYDAVVLGWGSVSHLLDEGERRELLQALRRLAPRVVMASFLSREIQTAETRAERIRWKVRRFLAWIRRRQPDPPGLTYMPYHRTVMYLYAPGEFEALAREAGFTVVLSAEAPYPHVLLAPGPETP